MGPFLDGGTFGSSVVAVRERSKAAGSRFVPGIVAASMAYGTCQWPGRDVGIGGGTVRTTGLPAGGEEAAMYSGEIIAGGGLGDFALVRHVRLGGSQRDVGHHIAELTWANHRLRPQPAPDPGLTRARRA